ncbi:GFA family protein [Paracoccus methylarcula]|uniref:GFA family protein n=1 Tax=Paracoccus methylarcula TaxID=72022 RepID=A0A422QU90_9RHOB|nr:GFA family protein [Paracoccus methylarcula]RNF33362.1 GFA family protein [Paracoccus methylarcula]
MTYQGSCHCGAVEFSVEGDLPSEVMECNCSHCRRKGFLLTFVPAGQFTLISGAEKLSGYRFNAHVIEHRFCAVCGTQPFAEGEQNGQPVRAINIRCVAEADLDRIKRMPVDGASF